MPHGWSSARGRVLARAGLGILTWVIPPGLVDEAVGDGLAWEMRLRSLPSRLGVYFVLGCALLSAKPYPDVIRQVTKGAERALAAAGWQAPATTALTAVRRRVGERPLESVFRRLCSALSPGRAPWSHLGGLLLVAVDGTTVGVAGSPGNAAAFGRPGAAAGKPASPAVRLVVLLACGTRGLLDAVFGPVRGKGSGEQALAGQLLGSLRAGMLVLADRNFYSWALWHAAAATGADLLWRAKASMDLTVIRELPDGSFLAHVNDPAAVHARNRRNGARRRRGSTLPPQTGPLPGMTIRVIGFRLEVTADDGSTRTERYRLITTLLDWRAFPAAGLAAAYARRWAVETGFRELKTILRGPDRLLRGRTPALARQELWAYLAIYQALRTLITRAAGRDGIDPARISFTTARDAAERTLGTAPAGLHDALASAETEMLRVLVPPRQGRIWPRAKKTRSPAEPRHGRPGPLAQHATYTVTITPPGQPAENTTDQPKQPAQPVNDPPLNSWHWVLTTAMWHCRG
ncbi:MAG TPA: IS4 family transposase [Streptosporangiaceae bacterium]|nr:IS4 family transposase [Streptosporangiaceae bacterium]